MDIQKQRATQTSQNIWTIIISVVMTALIIGGGLFLWQKTQTDVLRQEIQTLETQNESLVAQNKKISQDLSESKKPSALQELPIQNAPITNNTPPENTASSLCTAPPTITDIGSDVYPIDPKYRGVEFLGQLFTAYNCGQARLSKIFGVEGNNYTLGSAIWLKTNPSQSLINAFKSIGFKCAEGNSEISCKEWGLWDTIKVDDLMTLEPYHENFKTDDCRNCG